jgi:hypothetical protein
MKTEDLSCESVWAAWRVVCRYGLGGDEGEIFCPPRLCRVLFFE